MIIKFFANHYLNFHCFVIFSSHPITMKLHKLMDENSPLATPLAKQLFSNAMVSAGLVDDARTVVASLNELLTLALEKH